MVQSSNLSLEQFCFLHLKYKDTVQGTRDCHELLTHGTGGIRLIEKLKQQATDKPLLEEAINRQRVILQQEAQRDIEEENRQETAAFVPHITADFAQIAPSNLNIKKIWEDTPTPKIIIPPEISTRPFKQRLLLLKPLIQEHFAKWGNRPNRCNEVIDGYRGWLSQRRWQSVNFTLFDVDGNYIPDEPPPPPKGRTAKCSRLKN